MPEMETGKPAAGLAPCCAFSSVFSVSWNHQRRKSFVLHPPLLGFLESAQTLDSVLAIWSSASSALAETMPFCTINRQQGEDLRAGSFMNGEHESGCRSRGTAHPRNHSPTHQSHGPRTQPNSSPRWACHRGSEKTSQSPMKLIRGTTGFDTSSLG